MEFLSAQRLKSGNSRSLIFGVLMFGPGEQKIGHECEGKFRFYICIGMLLISLSCWCKGKYSEKYSLGFSEESYQEEYNCLSCCGSLPAPPPPPGGSLSIMNTLKTIQDPKRLRSNNQSQSCVQLLIFPMQLTTFSNQFYLPQKVNDATRRTN